MQEGGYRGDDTLGSRMGYIAMLPIIWIGVAIAAEEGSHGHVPGGPITPIVAWVALCVASFFGLRAIIRGFISRL